MTALPNQMSFARSLSMCFTLPSEQIKKRREAGSISYIPITILSSHFKGESEAQNEAQMCFSLNQEHFVLLPLELKCPPLLRSEAAGNCQTLLPFPI